MKYVVKDANGTQYVRVAVLPKPKENLAGRIEAWTYCQRCAARFTCDEAHYIAHASLKSGRVFRIRGKS
jgi:hypothetical protein